MGFKTCGFEFSAKSVRSVVGGVLAPVLALLAFVAYMPQLAFADEAFQTIDGTMTITLQGGVSGGGAGGGTGEPTVVTTSATTSGGTSSSVLTGDALIWLILGIVVLLVGAVYVIVKSRKLASAGTIASASATGASADTTTGIPAGSPAENLTSAKRKTIIVAVVTALIACACFGIFASKSNAFAKEALEGITGTSNVVVDEQGNVLSNDLAINNGSGVAIYINNIQAPDELNGWNASIKDETVQSGSSAKGIWDGKTIPASVLEQVKSNSNTSIELALKVSINKAFDFDKFSVDTDSATYGGNQIKPEVTSDVYKQGTDFEVIYGENKNAGEGTITIKGIGDYQGEKTYTFTIAPKEVSLVWSADSFTYNGQPQAPTATVGNLIEGDTVNVTVEGARTDAGTYTATATGLDNANYKLPAEATHSFTIEQKELTLTWGSETAFTYDGKSHVPTVTVGNLVEGDKVVVTVEGAQTNASDRTYTATAKIDNTNYKLPVDSTKNFTIARAEIVVSGITAKDKVYDGSTDAKLDCSKATLAGKVDGDDLTVTAEGAFEYASAGTNVEVAITKLTLGGTSAGNYKLARDGQQTSATATIEQVKLDFTKIAIDTKNATYTGEQIKPSITSDDYTEYVDYEVIYGKNINAGENAGSVTIKGIGNYTGEDTTTFTIAKANPNPTTPELTAETGQTLADVVLPKQTEPVPGTFAWEAEDPSAVSVGEAGTTPTFNAIFTPNDTNNYNTQVVTVPIAVTNAKTAFAVLFADNTLGFYNRVDIPKENEGFDEKTISAVYTGIENANYQPEWLDKAITSATVVDAGIQPKSTANWFALKDISKLTTVDVSKLETKNTTDMSSMFKGCSALTTVGDISSWNTANVTNMASMFEGCTTLEQAGDISGWNTAQVTNMTSMFKDCAKLKEDCSDWNVDNVGANHKDFDANAPGVQSPWDEDLDFSKFTVDTKVQTYCASQITPSVTSTDYTKDADYEVIYGANLRAGDGTITIKGLNKHQGEKTYTFAIHQKELGLTWNETSFTYDGKSHLPTITLEGVIEGDTVNHIVRGAEGINAGTYSVIAYIDNTNYMLPENYKTTFTINKAKVSVSGITVKSRVYDGTTRAGLDLSNVQLDGKLDTDELGITVEGAFRDANAGQAKTVDISITGFTGTSAKNYKLDEQSQQMSVTADIYQLVADVRWGDTELTYNANPQLPQAYVRNIVLGDTVNLTVATKDGKDAIKAGTYEAVPTALSNPNYILSENVHSQQFIIKKALLIVDGVIHAFSKNYDRTTDAEINLYWADITGVVGEDEVVVEAKGTFEDANVGEDKNVAITYTLSGQDAGNYEVDTTASIMSTTGTIESTTIDLDKISISPESATYTGKQITPEVSYEGLVQDEDFVVTYTENINAGENAGSVVVRGINNCTGQEIKTFDIAKADPSYTPIHTLSAEEGDVIGNIPLPAQTNGTLAWDSPTRSVGSVGERIFVAIFTPNDINNYNAIKIDITVEVTQAKPAFAVYSKTDNSLNFYKRTEVPTEGSAFENKEATAVYKNIETERYATTLTPWSSQYITNATVVDEGIHPVSTARWFLSSYHSSLESAPLEKADLSKLDTLRTTDMTSMFENCDSLTTVGDISQWDTSNVTSMAGMFLNCEKLSLDCSSWDVGKVGDNHNSFKENASKVISPWDRTAFAVYSETDHSLNFYKRSTVPTKGTTFDGKNATEVYTDIEKDVYGVDSAPWTIDRLSIRSSTVVDKGIAPVSTAYWFYGCYNLTSVDMSKLDTSNVTTMEDMFYASAVSSLDLSSFNTSNVTNMRAAFGECQSLTAIYGLEKWDTGNVADMAYMFKHCTQLSYVPVTSLEMKNVTTMEGMFKACSSLVRLDLSNWDVSSVKNLSSTFQNCESLISLGDLSGWNTSSVADMSYAFQNSSVLEADCSDWRMDGLTYYKRTGFNENAPGVITPWDAKTAFAIYSADDYSLCFYKAKTVPKEGSTYRGKIVTKVYAGLEDHVYRIGSVPWADYGSNVAESIEVVDPGIAPISTTNWFYGCRKVESADLSKLDTSRVTVMANMFYGCHGLQTANISNFDTSQVEDMSYMFCECGSLEYPDVSGFDTSKVTTMRYMFSNCASLTTMDFSKWDTSKVTDMTRMFAYCNGFTDLDLSSFNTSNVTDMNYMFSECRDLAHLNVSNFDTSRVTNMSYMFNQCRDLTLDCSGWKVDAVTDATNFNYRASGVTPPSWPSHVVTDSVGNSNSLSAVAKSTNESKAINGEENISGEATSTSSANEANSKVGSTAENDADLQEANCLSAVSKENATETEGLKAVA